MKTYALIENGSVINVIETDENGWPEGIDITDMVPRPGIGWQYDDEAGFITPAIPDPTPEPEPEPIPQNKIITNLAFDLRFTLEERVAIELASLDDPAASMEQRAMSAALRVSQERSRKAQFTDLSDPVTRGGVEQMEALELLAQGRAAEILDTPIEDRERPGYVAGT